jgi:hypothetical protein
MPSKNNLKRSVSAGGPKGAASKKSKPHEECCAGNPGPDSGVQVQVEPAVSPCQTGGESQAAEKEAAEIVTALANLAGSCRSFASKTKARTPVQKFRLCSHILRIWP